MPRHRFLFRAVAAWLLLMGAASVLDAQNCDATIDPDYCYNCIRDADLMALGCVLSGNCDWKTVYDETLAECLANITPPLPAPPTNPGGRCGEGGGKGSTAAARRPGFSLATPRPAAAVSRCGITFLDPVPLDQGGASLMAGNAINGSPSVLAQNGRAVQAVAADGAARVVVAIGTNWVGERIQLTVLDELGTAGQPAQQVGWLNSLNGSEGSENAGQLTLVAKNAGGQSIAFAVYHPPTDFSRYAQDDSTTNRSVTLQADSLDVQGYEWSAPLNLLRPPVVLINGLWGTRSDWTDVTNALNPVFKPGPTPIFYDRLLNISSSVPAYDQATLAKARANALGFSYNAPRVLDSIAEIIRRFRTGSNALGNQAAGTQVDVIAHSMGGLVARTLEKLSGFTDQFSFGVGNVHKLITIGTPHLGSPLAIELLFSSNDCVRKELAGKGNIAFSAVTVAGSSGPVTGAILDLQGDDTLGVPMSGALKAIQSPVNPNEAQTALIGATMSQANLSGLNCTFCAASALRSYCFGSPLAASLTASLWPNLFAEPGGTSDNDSVVSLPSQFARVATPPPFRGVIHSSGMELLDFAGPAELDAGSGIPAYLVNLLNAPLAPAPGDPRAGVFPFYTLSQAQ